MKPTSEQVERGVGALLPFVQEWNLPLNPEDLQELSYAVLVHHDSDASWDEIEVAVRAQIADLRRRHEDMLEAIRREHPDAEYSLRLEPDAGATKPPAAFEYGRRTRSRRCDGHVGNGRAARQVR